MGTAKTQFLQHENLLNSKPERVTHPLFDSIDFFDPLDLAQVRYELLRAARGGECLSVSGSCKLFGVSREYFYQLERAFNEKGLVALLGSPMGRRPLLALNQEIIAFIVHKKLEDPSTSCETIRQEILRCFKVQCSLRTVERVVEKIGLGKRGLSAP